MIRGESKVTPVHLDRTAIIYIRQSTLVQVREHTESTLRQYDLAAQAARLGWSGADIQVIDCDLGLSGRTASGRDGFKHLVARVCLGEVGAVFGLEVSRLARSNADLARLLELARLTDTLVIDADGVYDLSDFNDRLVRHEVLRDRVEVKDHHHRAVAAVREKPLNTGSSRMPSRLAHHARPIRQYWTDSTSSRLLPPSPASPGPGCRQLHPTATTARR